MRGHVGKLIIALENLRSSVQITFNKTYGAEP